MRKVLLNAEPEAIEIEVSKAALILVDMQNAFIEEGGYFHMLGRLQKEAGRVRENCRILLEVSRSARLHIVYLKMVVPKERDAWEDRLSLFRKSPALSFLSAHPDKMDRLYVEDCWGSEIVRDLAPREGEIVLKKRTYDGFLGTPLDLVLRGHGVTHLIFAGVATNICVETTLRHAFCLGYFPILVQDATLHVGEESLKEATILNVKSHFGWVARLEDLRTALTP